MEEKSEIQTFVVETGSPKGMADKIQEFLDKYEIDKIHAMSSNDYRTIILAEGKKTRLS